MTNPTYPTITDASIVPFRAIEAQLKAFPDILDRPDCPYSVAVRTFLRRVCGETVATPAGPMSDDDLVTETSTLYRDVRLTSQTMRSADPKDAASLYKTMADLLTKLVTLREKALNIRAQSQFQRAVLTMLETVVTPAQRSEFVELMGKWIEDNNVQ